MRDLISYCLKVKVKFNNSLSSQYDRLQITARYRRIAFSVHPLVMHEKEVHSANTAIYPVKS
jgi:hypothetical protein